MNLDDFLTWLQDNHEDLYAEFVSLDEDLTDGFQPGDENEDLLQLWDELCDEFQEETGQQVHKSEESHIRP